MSYKIIEGFPEKVEAEVQQLRSEGWHLNGPLFPRIQDGYHLVVQSMYHDDINILEAASSSDEAPAPSSLQDLISRIIGETND